MYSTSSQMAYSTLSEVTKPAYLYDTSSATAAAAVAVTQHASTYSWMKDSRTGMFSPTSSTPLKLNTGLYGHAGMTAAASGNGLLNTNKMSNEHGISNGMTMSNSTGSNSSPSSSLSSSSSSSQVGGDIMNQIHTIGKTSKKRYLQNYLFF